MKANELRIGNLLQGYSGQLFEITIDDLMIIENGDSKAKPIPLTEEWLLKFGFEFGIKLQDFARGKYQFVQLKNKILYGEFSEEGIFYYNTKTKIKYVHQLQNLYFALTGGKELELKH